MKNKKLELDVDFIGAQPSILTEEEKAISEYIKSHKTKTKQQKAKAKVNV